ncbi:MAG: sterol desaturase family protein [Fluviicoccus sp.]|uniref:sterol desaturase family protein n=1 Tax=Fluviicoccus sp. TaxID=2003552 RepID=UPI00271E12B3|nr:sterol desaturase family protein [Fluviicoccus sp.]MDO8331236.1 sterol desaturase family protein [Fluviicoccus sp.]
MWELVRLSLNAPVTVIYSAMYALWTLLILTEIGWSRALGQGLYRRSELLANLGLFAGYSLVNLFWVHAVFWLYTLAAQFKIVALGSGYWHLFGHGGWQEWLLLFVLEDLCFYTFHRFHHRFAFLWLAHVPHHSSPDFNLSTALRQTWTPFTAVVFWLPLALLGFDPLMIMTMQMCSLFYQFFLHTQVVGSLGPLDWVLNTPRHHRVHHASNAPYVDRNFGGVLIVWDRLFGTFAKEEAGNPVRFGVEPAVASANPVVIALGAYADWWRSLSKTGKA